MKPEVAGLLKKVASSRRAAELRTLDDYGVGTGVTREQLRNLLAWYDEFYATAVTELK